jgi:hypothetical protein
VIEASANPQHLVISDAKAIAVCDAKGVYNQLEIFHAYLEPWCP